MAEDALVGSEEAMLQIYDVFNDPSKYAWMNDVEKQAIVKIRTDASIVKKVGDALEPKGLAREKVGAAIEHLESLRGGWIIRRKPEYRDITDVANAVYGELDKPVPMKIKADDLKDAYDLIREGTAEDLLGEMAEKADAKEKRDKTAAEKRDIAATAAATVARLTARKAQMEAEANRLAGEVADAKLADEQLSKDYFEEAVAQMEAGDPTNEAFFFDFLNKAREKLEALGVGETAIDNYISVVRENTLPVDTRKTALEGLRNLLVSEVTKNVRDAERVKAEEAEQLRIEQEAQKKIEEEQKKRDEEQKKIEEKEKKKREEKEKKKLEKEEKKRLKDEYSRSSESFMQLMFVGDKVKDRALAEVEKKKKGIETRGMDMGLFGRTMKKGKPKNQDKQSVVYANRLYQLIGEEVPRWLTPDKLESAHDKLIDMEEKKAKKNLPAYSDLVAGRANNVRSIVADAAGKALTSGDTASKNRLIGLLRDGVLDSEELADSRLAAAKALMERGALVNREWFTDEDMEKLAPDIRAISNHFISTIVAAREPVEPPEEGAGPKGLTTKEAEELDFENYRETGKLFRLFNSGMLAGDELADERVKAAKELGTRHWFVSRKRLTEEDKKKMTEYVETMSKLDDTTEVIMLNMENLISSRALSPEDKKKGEATLTKWRKAKVEKEEKERKRIKREARQPILANTLMSNLTPKPERDEVEAKLTKMFNNKSLVGSARGNFIYYELSHGKKLDKGKFGAGEVGANDKAKLFERVEDLLTRDYTEEMEDSLSNILDADVLTADQIGKVRNFLEAGKAEKERLAEEERLRQEKEKQEQEAEAERQKQAEEERKRQEAEAEAERKKQAELQKAEAEEQQVKDEIASLKLEDLENALKEGDDYKTYLMTRKGFNDTQADSFMSKLETTIELKAGQMKAAAESQYKDKILTAQRFKGREFTDLIALINAAKAGTVSAYRGLGINAGRTVSDRRMEMELNLLIGDRREMEDEIKAQQKKKADAIKLGDTHVALHPVEKMELPELKKLSRQVEETKAADSKKDFDYVIERGRGISTEQAEHELGRYRAEKDKIALRISVEKAKLEKERLEKQKAEAEKQGREDKRTEAEKKKADEERAKRMAAIMPAGWEAKKGADFDAFYADAISKIGPLTVPGMDPKEKEALENTKEELQAEVYRRALRTAVDRLTGLSDNDFGRARLLSQDLRAYGNEILTGIRKEDVDELNRGRMDRELKQINFEAALLQGKEAGGESAYFLKEQGSITLPADQVALLKERNVSLEKLGVKVEAEPKVVTVKRKGKKVPKKEEKKKPKKEEKPKEPAKVKGKKATEKETAAPEEIAADVTSEEKEKKTVTPMKVKMPKGAKKPTKKKPATPDEIVDDIKGEGTGKEEPKSEREEQRKEANELIEDLSALMGGFFESRFEVEGYRKTFKKMFEEEPYHVFLEQIDKFRDNVADTKQQKADKEFMARQKKEQDARERRKKAEEQMEADRKLRNTRRKVTITKSELLKIGGEPEKKKPAPKEEPKEKKPKKKKKPEEEGESAEDKKLAEMLAKQEQKKTEE